MRISDVTAALMRVGISIRESGCHSRAYTDDVGFDAKVHMRRSLRAEVCTVSKISDLLACTYHEQETEGEFFPKNLHTYELYMIRDTEQRSTSTYLQVGNTSPRQSWHARTNQQLEHSWL